MSLILYEYIYSADLRLPMLLLSTYEFAIVDVRKVYELWWWWDEFIQLYVMCHF